MKNDLNFPLSSEKYLYRLFACASKYRLAFVFLHFLLFSLLNIVTHRMLRAKSVAGNTRHDFQNNKFQKCKQISLVHVQSLVCMNRLSSQLLVLS